MSLCPLASHHAGSRPSTHTWQWPFLPSRLRRPAPAAHAQVSPKRTNVPGMKQRGRGRGRGRGGAGFYGMMPPPFMPFMVPYGYGWVPGRAWGRAGQGRAGRRAGQGQRTKQRGDRHFCDLPVICASTGPPHRPQRSQRTLRAVWQLSMFARHCCQPPSAHPHHQPLLAHPAPTLANHAVLCCAVAPCRYAPRGRGRGRGGYGYSPY